MRAECGSVVTRCTGLDLAETLSTLTERNDNCGNMSSPSLSKQIKDIEKDIIATSMEDVKANLSKDGSGKLNSLRDKIVEFCKVTYPEFPKGKPVRRITRSGGRTANEKLASDIVAMVKFCGSKEVTAELNELFPKLSSHSEASFIDLLSNSQDQSNPKTSSQEERKQLMTLVENLDAKLSQLKEDFDDKILILEREVGDLKSNLCEKQAKIYSLESELASFKGNYKSNKENMLDKLGNHELQLGKHRENLNKLENILLKSQDRSKKQLSSNRGTIDLECPIEPEVSLHTKANSYANTTRQTTIVRENQSSEKNLNSSQSNFQLSSKENKSTSSTVDKQAQTREHENQNIGNHVGTEIVNDAPSDLRHDQVEDSGSFVGVERRSIKRVYLGGVREGVNVGLITTFMERKGTSPTFVRLFSSKRKGTVAVRVNVNKEDFDRVLENEFWPEHVYARPWVSKQNWLKKSSEASVNKNNHSEQD